MLGWGRGSIRITVTVASSEGGLLDGVASGLFGRLTLERVRAAGRSQHGAVLADTRRDELAAILFTSGSTGVPKGAVYTHGNFAAQIEILRAIGGIEDGEIDLPTFAPFALFDPALGMTTVVPEMDFAQPAAADPARIAAAITTHGVTSMFGSPALLRGLARWGVPRGLKLPSLRRVISAGAPVSPRIIEGITSMLAPGARFLTPFGATEALPVTVIAGDEILADTAVRTAAGAGVCVGRPVPGVDVAVIEIRDDEIPAWRDDLRKPVGEIGEIAVRGAVVTRSYWKRDRSTALAKIRAPVPSGRAPVEHDLWHRMGDVGYLDETGRLWFCGRKAQRVILGEGRTLFPVPCEGVFNAHPAVRRTALVGVPRPGRTVPVLCVQLETDRPAPDTAVLFRELRELGARHEHTAVIETFLIHPGFPVDRRHNAKIHREELATWATRRLARAGS